MSQSEFERRVHHFMAIVRLTYTVMGCAGIDVAEMNAAGARLLGR